VVRKELLLGLDWTGQKKFGSHEAGLKSRRARDATPRNSQILPVALGNGRNLWFMLWELATLSYHRQSVEGKQVHFEGQISASLSRSRVLCLDVELGALVQKPSGKFHFCI
jgi:hypothetical protein